MTRRIIIGGSVFLILLSLGMGSPSAEVRKTPFSAKFSDEIIRVKPGEPFEFTVDFVVPKGYYLYDGKTMVLFEKKEDVLWLHSQRPPAEDYFDPFFKKTLKVHFKDFREKIFFRIPENAAPGRRTLEARLSYQGCSKEFCYRPVKKTILLPVEVEAPVAKIHDVRDVREPDAGADLSRIAPSKLSFWDMLKEHNPERLLNQGKVYLLALALMGGILTSFTPCVLPIIPLTLAFIGVRRRRRRNLFRAFMLVAGMVSMYSLLGFLAASLGLKLGFLFQSRVFVLLTALFFLIFSLGLFEVIPFHLPPKLHHNFTRMGGEGPVGAFVAGLTIGLVASPCVGPLIAPLLLIAAKTQDRAYGFLLLLNYGIGMGLIFLILASGFAELSSKIKSGRWTHLIKRGLAVLMLAPALYYGYAFAKPYLGPPPNSFWVYDFEEGLALAGREGKPVLLDFYADWCPPCVELDKRTFSAPEVRGRAREFIMVKVDCTVDDANCQKASDRYEVVGWPTILFLRSNGELIEDVRLVSGFAGKEKMLRLMDEALEKSKKE